MNKKMKVILLFSICIFVVLSPGIKDVMAQQLTFVDPYSFYKGEVFIVNPSNYIVEPGDRYLFNEIILRGSCWGYNDSFNVTLHYFENFDLDKNGTATWDRDFKRNHTIDLSSREGRPYDRFYAIIQLDNSSLRPEYTINLTLPGLLFTFDYQMSKLNLNLDTNLGWVEGIVLFLAVLFVLALITGFAIAKTIISRALSAPDTETYIIMIITFGISGGPIFLLRMVLLNIDFFNTINQYLQVMYIVLFVFVTIGSTIASIFFLSKRNRKVVLKLHFKKRYIPLGITTYAEASDGRKIFISDLWADFFKRLFTRRYILFDQKLINSSYDANMIENSSSFPLPITHVLFCNNDQLEEAEPVIITAGKMSALKDANTMIDASKKISRYKELYGATARQLLFLDGAEEMKEDLDFRIDISADLNHRRKLSLIRAKVDQFLVDERIYTLEELRKNEINDPHDVFPALQESEVSNDEG